ncbi:hypothetical protein STEG23_001502, partial [Scotinomys teguina]
AASAMSLPIRTIANVFYKFGIPLFSLFDWTPGARPSVWLWICFHQLLDECSMMTVSVFTNLVMRFIRASLFGFFWLASFSGSRKFHGVLRRSRKMGPVFVSILLTCVFLLVGKIFFNDFVEYVFCAFELVFFSFFYSYYSKGDWLLLDPLLPRVTGYSWVLGIDSSSEGDWLLLRLKK